MRDAMRSLVRGIVASHKARATDIASVRRDVSSQRKLDRSHIQELTVLRRDAARTLHGQLAREHGKLARSEGRRKAGARKWLAGVASARTQQAAQARTERAEASAKFKEEVQASLKSLASARAIMSRHLMKDLAQAAADRRSGVLGWLGDLSADRLAARREWGQMVTAFHAGKAGVMTADAPAPKPKKARAAAKTPPVTEEQESGADTRGAASEPGALQDRVVGYLADHPDGVRLVNIEQEFSLNRLESSRLVRVLLEEGKVRKQERVYFAT